MYKVKTNLIGCQDGGGYCSHAWPAATKQPNCTRDTKPTCLGHIHTPPRAAASGSATTSSCACSAARHFGGQAVRQARGESPPAGLLCTVCRQRRTVCLRHTTKLRCAASGGATSSSYACIEACLVGGGKKGRGTLLVV